jgi:hypothetical protein
MDACRGRRSSGAVGASRGMMVLFVKQVHLQKEVGAVCVVSGIGGVERRSGKGGERRDGQAAWTLRRGEGGRVVRRRVRRREGGVRARIFSGGGGVGGGGC